MSYRGSGKAWFGVCQILGERGCVLRLKFPLPPFPWWPYVHEKKNTDSDSCFQRPSRTRLKSQGYLNDPGQTSLDRSGNAPGSLEAAWAGCRAAVHKPRPPLTLPACKSAKSKYGVRKGAPRPTPHFICAPQ